MSSSYQNIFKNYFENSGIAYQTTPIVCDGAQNKGKDLSFDFHNGQGQISDGKNVVGSIDLSDTSYPLTEYASQTKILAPFTSYFLSGNTNGPSYAAQFFDSCLEEENYSNWRNFVNIQFNFSHICNFKQTTTRFEVYRDNGNSESFVDIVQKMFDNENIPVQIDVENIRVKDSDHEFITFRSNQIGYEFMVTDVRLIPVYQNEEFPESPFSVEETMFLSAIPGSEESIYDFFPNETFDSTVINTIYNSIVNKTELSEEFLNEWYGLIDFIRDTSPEVHKIYEYFPFRVNAQKYPNGAMGGLVLKVEYPDNSSISQVKINHVKDCISVYNPVTLTEDASLVQDCKHTSFDDWHTPTVHDTVLFQKFNYNVRATYVNPEESDCHDWMDGGVYVHRGSSDKVEDDGWISGTRALNIARTSKPQCSKRYVTNKKKVHSEDDWCGMDPMQYSDDLYWADGHVDTQDFIGMYGYLNEVNKSRLWGSIGSYYSIFGGIDEENSNDKNLVPSLFIFNANPVPVKITYMIFS